ncbi:M48 family metalloprotease [Parasphingorhabdus flavimaris]|uniref:M48 family metalloprotease n=1 Tax=Parasphingorhabdus flavimaris TaxID=266812 RepID=A0ABX2N025_9SPHN|nr:M48 family metalloprotease [Parasphingorhabdus flavimaris]NVD27060.1 M48 family metalloprotease [Parasphingorhabdus flavimaris]|tara:strand:- start:6028 stop:7428 length:1401 start_codon:yes stop_codon:yes gene_type:complete
MRNRFAFSPSRIDLPALGRLTRFIAALLVIVSITVQPVAAQSILRDAETEALFTDMVAPLVAVSELDAEEVEVVLINDNQINAFVAGGQRMFFYSGLIETADSANEVQGVMAHELGHITGGHIIRFDEGVKTATGITILSLILGAAAIAAGAGDAGMGILAAGQQAAMGKFLAFSRVQERSADSAGARYLSEAGISGKGSIDFFKKLQNYEFRLGIPQEDSYGRTHPLSGERVTLLRDVYQADPAWNKPSDPDIEARFQRVKAKLLGFTADPTVTLREYPESDQSVPGRYARAYAWHKSAYPDRALYEVTNLLKSAPNDPYFLELHGQILLESGKPDEALRSLRRAVQLTNNQPLIASLFGHALIATEDPQYFDEATQVLKAAVNKDNRNPFAWYQLGVVYSQQGDMPRAQLATAESSLLQRNYAAAIRSSQIAMSGIAENTPDWIRAQDISFIAKAEFERDSKRR